ncbi:MAG: hypothetical protein AAB403_03665 [Planctomycetota bacterium]
MKALELNWPLRDPIIAQRFGQNDSPTYAANGLRGHTGIDLVTSYGDTVRFAQDGRVYKFLNFNNPDLTKYRAVCQIIDLDGTDDCYEIHYGHCTKALCGLGPVETGDAAGLEGNIGVVTSKYRIVTTEEKLAGSTAGTHLHFQLRYCRKVTAIDPTKQYLDDLNGKPYFDGKYYYFVPHYENGFNGCVDPLPYMTDMYAGDEAVVVSKLQQVIDLLRRFIGIRWPNVKPVSV